jgi:long-subunit acyl-CoA synthetase (AMP-forming)
VRLRLPRYELTRCEEILTDAQTGRAYTFADVRHVAHEFGKGLKARWAWKKGDVLALFTPNSIDTPVVSLGAIWAGGVVTPANPLYTVDELTFQLRDSKAKGLVTQVSCLDVAVQAAKKAGIPDNRIILLGDKRDPAGKYRHFCSIRSTSYTGWYAKSSIDAKNDLAAIVYSSGTTGLPKGVCLTHTNLVANLMQFVYVEGPFLQPHGGADGLGDKLLGVLPVFHIYVSPCLSPPVLKLRFQILTAPWPGSLMQLSWSRILRIPVDYDGKV